MLELRPNCECCGAELPNGATLSADAGYFSEDNIRITNGHGLDPYIATGRFKHSEPPPPAPRGPIPKDATAKQRMARKLRTQKGAAVYRRRKAIVEPVFGQIQTVQNGRQLLLRGKQAARGEWRFHCAIHNLLKLHRAGGLGLIHQPRTAPGAAAETRRPGRATPRATIRALTAHLHRPLANATVWNSSVAVTDSGS